MRLGDNREHEMASFNKVILMGNLTRDPQLSYLPSQTPVVEFGLAVNRRWRGGDGQQKEEVCFIDCRAFGKPAETINQYLAKGRAILIEGRLQFDSWEGKDGVKRSRHRVVVEEFRFLGQAPAGGAPQRAPAAGQYPQQGGAQPAQSSPAMEEPPPAFEEPSGEDIPF